jgi:hypothetical protein
MDMTASIIGGIGGKVVARMRTSSGGKLTPDTVGSFDDGQLPVHRRGAYASHVDFLILH